MSSYENRREPDRKDHEQLPDEFEAGLRHEDLTEVARDEITISEQTEKWLDESNATIGRAVEYVRASEQHTNAEVTLWRYLTSNRTNVYREIVSALIDADEEFRRGECRTPNLTYDELEERLNCDLSRPQLTERLTTLDEGGVIQRSGMPRVISFVNEDVVVLARAVLTKVAPRV